jgi:hypothetical protein
MSVVGVQRLLKYPTVAVGDSDYGPQAMAAMSLLSDSTGWRACAPRGHRHRRFVRANSTDTGRTILYVGIRGLVVPRPNFFCRGETTSFHSV